MPESWAKRYQPFLENLPGFCNIVCQLKCSSQADILETLFELHVCDQEKDFDLLFPTFPPLFKGLPADQSQLKTRLMNAVYDSHSTRFVSSHTGHQKLIRDLIQNIAIFGHIQSKEIDKYHEYERLRPRIALLGHEMAQLLDLSKEKKTLFNGTDLVSALVCLISQDPNAVNQISSQLHHFRWAIEDLDSLRFFLYDLCASDGDSVVQPLRSRVAQLITEQYFSGLIKKIQTYSLVDVTSLFVLLQDPHLNLTDQCRAVTCLEKALKQNKRLSEAEIHTCFLNELVKMEDEDIHGDPRVSQYNAAQLNDKLRLMMAMSEIREALTWRPKLNFLRKAALLLTESPTLTATQLSHYEKELHRYEHHV